MLRIGINSELPDGGRNGYDVWVAATEVTVAQFRQCQPDKYIAEDFSPSPDCPANVVTWPQAVAYCNWLSEQHGLPPFYPTDREELLRWRATPEMLKEPGYRLPTAREWHVAASGGSETELHFGNNHQMILRYDWLQENSQNQAIANRPVSYEKATKRSGYQSAPSRPVGSLRPNEFGLFDVYSNVVEWTSDVGGSNASEREVRGLSVGATLEVFYLLQFQSGSHAPMVEYNSLGLRVVRTCETDKGRD